jgi:predicted PurR-regulated permease PerM
MLLLVLRAGLCAALLTGLATYVMYTALLRRLSHSASHGVAAIASLIITIGILLLVGGISAEGLRTARDGVPGLLTFMAESLDRARAGLPPWVAGHLPESTEAMRQVASEWLRGHAASLQRWGESALHVAAQMLVGAAIGLLCAFDRRPRQWIGWASNAQRMLVDLSTAFSNFVSAQVRIAAINTVLTGIFLLAVLPLAGVHLPWARTLVAVTFVGGLVPIVGNLFSNTAIVLAGLAVSPAVAVGALVFLLVIHKLEYFLNAHIVGTMTNVPAPVLLASMLLLEALFGIAGVVAAPIYCAWIFFEFGIMRPADAGPPNERTGG